MKRIGCAVLLLIALVIPAKASVVPDEVKDALPEVVGEALEEAELTDISGFTKELRNIWRAFPEMARKHLSIQGKDTAAVFFVVLLCGLVGGFSWCTAPGTDMYLTMAGAAAITTLTVGSINSLIGLGTKTIAELRGFSSVLLPTLAAAAAASGSVSMAAFQQLTAAFLVDVFLEVVNSLLVPLMYLYIGLLTVAAGFPDGQLAVIAEGMKKVITWILGAVLSLFTLYLSLVRIISGSIDGTAVRVTRTAIAGVVPVVGNIIAEASETILAGAGVLKNTVGMFGVLAVLMMCAYPFLQLFLQYLLYRLMGFLTGFMGQPRLSGLIHGLGGAFGLILGMVGSGAALLLISIFSCIAAVVL